MSISFTFNVNFERPGYCCSIAVADLTLDSIYFGAFLYAFDNNLITVDMKFF